MQHDEVQVLRTYVSLSYKKSFHEYFSRLGAQGPVIAAAAFNPLAAERLWYADKGSLPQSVRQWWV